MDVLIGYILLAGVFISMAFIAAGLLWQYLITGKLGLDYQIIGMNLAQFVATEVRAVAAGRVYPETVINWGILSLMLTPYFRVLASVVYFMVGLKNVKYTAFTAFVLLVLTYSLFLR